MANTYSRLIDGKEISTGKIAQVFDKFSGEAIGQVFVAGPEQLEQAVSAAFAARGKRAELSSFRRAEIIRKAAGILRDRKETIAGLIAREAGKPLKYASTEVERAIENLEYVSEEAKRIHGETVPIDAGKSGAGRFGYYERFPVGVVAAITPFNFPLNLVAHKIGPAVAAGCPIVFKPASTAPLTGFELAKAFAEAGLPAGGLNTLFGSGKEIGDPLVADPRIAKISFTGSRAVGERIIRIAGLKKVTLELGGNCGVVIDKDLISLDYAVNRCLMGAFANQGQVCISVQRIYVHRKRYDEFLKSFIAKTNALKMGNPIDPATDIGPMITEDDARRLDDWIGEAQKQGAKVVAGGKHEGVMYHPTVITDAKPEMKIVKDELFGPVVVVIPVDSFEDGVKACDEGSYGLQAGVFTSNINRAYFAVRAINAGGIVVNDVPTFRIDHMPYGGNKGSGIGREGSRFAIDEMTTIRMVVFNLNE